MAEDTKMPLTSQDMLNAYNEVFKGQTKTDRENKILENKKRKLQISGLESSQSQKNELFEYDRLTRETPEQITARRIAEQEARDFEREEREQKRSEWQHTAAMRPIQIKSANNRITEFERQTRKAEQAGDIETLQLLNTQLKAYEDELASTFDWWFVDTAETKLLKQRIDNLKQQKRQQTEKIIDKRTTGGSESGEMTSVDRSAMNFANKFPDNPNSAKIIAALKKKYNL